MEESITGKSPFFNSTVMKLTDDMRFVGMFYIIFGALYCITIIGAIIGIPLIISGLRLRESAESFQLYLNSNETNFLESALERQGRFFFIQKVLMIIALVLLVLYIIFILVVGVTLFNTFMNMSKDFETIRISYFLLLMN
ncbi:MAG: DUF5362 domain-containing protein [Ignavibacteria bacterium]|nr:DUF5362 domain-containing protein [Ignavibacteria bacterium]